MLLAGRTVQAGQRGEAKLPDRLPPRQRHLRGPEAAHHPRPQDYAGCNGNTGFRTVNGRPISNRKISRNLHNTDTGKVA